MKTEIKFNKANYELELQSIQQGADNLNELVTKVCSYLKEKTPSAKLLANIKEDATEVIASHVLNSVPETLQNASFDFKLQSLGFEGAYNDISDYVTNIRGSWISYEYEVKNAKFVISELTKNLTREKHTIYVDSELDLQKFKYFKELKTLLNNGFENGFLNIYARPQIISTIKELNLEVPEDKNEFEVVINPYSLLANG
jgi:hypothetical protein